MGVKFMAKITGLTGKLGLLLSLSLITACSLTVEDPEPGQLASPSPASTPISFESPEPTQSASPGPTSTPVTSEGSEPTQSASPGPTSTPVTSEGPGPTQSASPGPTSTPVTSEGSESTQLGFPYPPSTLIKGVRFDWSSHVRLAEGSDNWAITWADDDHQYSAWGDGGGFGGSDERGRVSLGVAKIQGAFEDYEPLNIWGGHNASYAADFEGKSYGIIFIDGVLYMWVSPGSLTESYEEAGLFHSTDYGATWTPVEWAFVKGDGLIMPTILNFGKNYAGARDNFVYHYFIELQGDPDELSVHIPGKVHLLRVDKSEILTSKNSYEYFNGLDGNGDPIWSDDINFSQPVFEDPNGVGWNLAVSYNAGLERYLLTTEHTETNQGNLGIFDAPEPWGPWTTVAYMNRSDGTRFAHDFRGVPETTFFWNFANKWLSEDGQEFTLVFTGTNDNDSWNTVRGSFEVAGSSPAKSP
jgi:hypothetical protein